MAKPLSGVLPQKEWKFTDIAKKAVFGKDAVYPFTPGAPFGDTLVGADRSREAPSRFHTLNDLLLVPRLFLPSRLRKASELAREPVYSDVETACVLGGFKTTLPLVLASMGSTGVANKRGLALSKGAAKAGIIQVIGENVVTVRGYDRRVSENQPSFKERVMSYLENLVDDMGGLLIQQSVEDAVYELWNKVYSDPDIDPYFHRGLVGFEVKCGQGAKPGLGGEIRVNRETALRLKKAGFYFPDDPEAVVKDWYDRHATPGTYTEDIFRESIQLAVTNFKSNFPHARIWVKTGAFRDVLRQIEIAQEAGADAVTVDGKEGGSGMSPSIALQDLGYPTITCLKQIWQVKKKGTKIHLILSGGLSDGGDLLKALCLGADGVAFGRAFIIASDACYQVGEQLVRLEDPADGVRNFVEAVKVEVQMLASALGKYSLDALDSTDIVALDHPLSEMFAVEYAYA